MTMDFLKSARRWIFDMDGVLASERYYWDVARLTVWDLLREQGVEAAIALETPAMALRDGGLIPDPEIDLFKESGINSNWHLAYAYSVLSTAVVDADDARREFLTKLKLGGGPELTNLLTAFHAAQGAPMGAMVAFESCAARFQTWLDRLPEEGTFANSPIADQVIVVERLDRLSNGSEFAIATGRPRNEAVDGLSALGLAAYFEAEDIVTHDEVSQAETELGVQGLGKPHPYVVLRAAEPDGAPEDWIAAKNLPTEHSCVYIGDGVSDALAARAAGIDFIGVLSGCASDTGRVRRRAEFEKLGARLICDDVGEALGSAFACGEAEE